MKGATTAAHSGNIQQLALEALLRLSLRAHESAT
jgi:hypothetical protein